MAKRRSEVVRERDQRERGAWPHERAEAEAAANAVEETAAVAEETNTASEETKPASEETKPATHETAEGSVAKCDLCGEPMPPGEQSLRYHGFSGPCPKPPLSEAVDLERPWASVLMPVAPPSNYAADHVEMRLKAHEAAALDRLWTGCQRENVFFADGRRVVSRADVVRLMLEKFGEAMEA